MIDLISVSSNFGLTKHRETRYTISPPGRITMARQQPELQTVSQVITALGGDDGMSAWLGIPRADIRRWIAAGEIHRAYALHVYLSLQVAGYRVSSLVFGLSDWADFVHPGIGPYAAKRREWHKPRASARRA